MVGWGVAAQVVMVGKGLVVRVATARVRGTVREGE
jgi:hypothetical protein